MTWLFKKQAKSESNKGYLTVYIGNDIELGSLYFDFETYAGMLIIEYVNNCFRVGDSDYHNSQITMAAAEKIVTKTYKDPGLKLTPEEFKIVLDKAAYLIGSSYFSKNLDMQAVNEMIKNLYLLYKDRCDL